MPIVPVNRNKSPARNRPVEQPESYEVGYGKPPQHSRFLPGRSGNPKGRPKHAMGFKTIIRATMLQKLKVQAGGRERMISRAEALVMKSIELASKGNFKAVQSLLGWYQIAVPETAEPARTQPSHEELSETDRATLEALREHIKADLDQ